MYENTKNILWTEARILIYRNSHNRRNVLHSFFLSSTKKTLFLIYNFSFSISFSPYEPPSAHNVPETTKKNLYIFLLFDENKLGFLQFVLLLFSLTSTLSVCFRSSTKISKIINFTTAKHFYLMLFDHYISIECCFTQKKNCTDFTIGFLHICHITQSPIGAEISVFDVCVAVVSLLR